MSKVITGSMDVTLIDKGKIVTGKKVREDKTVGKYLNFALIPTPNGKFGDFMVVQELTKEERAAGKKSIILGNAKFPQVKTEEAPAAEDDGQPENTPW